jgi:hypothetical protein
LPALLAEMAAEVQELTRAAGGSIADVAADWITAQYMLALRKQLAATPDAPEQLKLMQRAAADVAPLRRGGHSAARLQLDREELEFKRQKHRDALAAAQPAAQKLRDFNTPLSDENRVALVHIIDDIMGIKH